MKGWVLALLLLPAAAPDAGWKRYDNGRYGYSVCYPAEVLRPQGEAGDGDGQAFKSRDGKVTVLAFGEYEQPGEKGQSAFQAKLAEALDGAKERHFALAYKVVKPHLFVLSGASPTGTVWYRKTIEVQDRAITLDFEYPQSAKAQMDPLVAKMSDCLVAGRMSF